MNRNQSNKFGMYNGVLSQLDSRSENNNIPQALQTGRDDLQAKIREIEQKDQEKGTVTSGKTVVKNQTGHKLIDQIMIISGPLTAWAVVNDNPEIKAIAGDKRSYLTRIRDNELGQKAEAILNAAEQQLSGLADYGVTQDHLTSLQALIETYRSALGDKESSFADRVSASVSLKTLFQEADEVLKLRLDPLMESIRPIDDDFYYGYKAARVIKDLRGSAGRRTSAATEATAAAGTVAVGSGSQY